MKNKKTISLIAIFMVIIMVLSLSGCNKKSNKELTKVRLNEVVRSAFYAPMYVAIEKGFFKDQGIEIDLSTGQGADTTMA